MFHLISLKMNEKAKLNTQTFIPKYQMTFLVQYILVSDFKSKPGLSGQFISAYKATFSLPFLKNQAERAIHIPILIFRNV